MKRVVLGLLLLVLCGAAGLLWFGWPHVTDLLRLRLERELSRAVGSPSRVQELTISVVPLRARLSGVAVGTPPIAEIGRVDVRLEALASLFETRPVVTVAIESPAVDLSQLPPSTPGNQPRPSAAGGGLPPFHLKRLAMTQGRLRFRMDHTIANLTVDAVEAQVKTGLLGQGLTASATVHGVELQRKSYRAKLDEILADGGADAGGLYVNAATVKGEGISASARATGTPHVHAVSATFDPGILGIVVDELSFIGGQATVEGTLAGDLANPVLDGHLAIQRGAIGHHALGDLDAHVTRTGTKLSFDNLRLVGKPGQVSGAVSLIIDKEVPIHGDLHWQGVDLEQLLAVIGQPVPFSNLFDAGTTVNGALDPLDLAVHGAGVLKTVEKDAAKDAASWDISSRIHPHDLQAQLTITQPEGNQVSTQVALEGAKMEKLTGTISLKAADLAALNRILPRPLPRLALTGQAEGKATLSGPTERPVVAGMMTMTNLTVVGVPATRVSGDFTIDGARLKTTKTAMETGGGGAELTGMVALDDTADNDWRLSFHDVSTDLAAGVLRGFTGVETSLSGGTLNGTFLCHNPWARGDTQLGLTAASLQLYGEPLDRIDVKATTMWPQWTLHLGAIHHATETLTIDATGEGTARLQATLDSTPFNLANVRGAGRRRLTGTAAVHGRFSGEALRPDGSFALTASALGIGGHALGDVAVHGGGRQGTWTVDGSALAGTLNLAGSVSTTATLPYTLDVTWQDTNLAKLMAADESLHVTSTGAINVTGSLRAPATPSGVIRITGLTVSRDQGTVSLAEPVQIDIQDGRFRIRSLALAAQGSRLTATGEWTLSGDVGLDLRGDADLVLLELLGRPFNAARGQLLVTARVERAPGAGWSVAGQATLRDAVLDLGLPVAFTDVNGQFTLAGSRVGISNLGGRTGGGEFSLGGAIDLNRGPDVSWSLREVALTMPEWLEERVSGKGQVQGTWRVLTVSGNIEVLNAVYDRRLELVDLLPWFKEHVAPAPRVGPAVTTVKLDLQIHAPDGLFIDNNFAKAEMRADLSIAGDTDKPSVRGTVEILNGEVTFRNRVFTLSGGAIDFTDPYQINPVLNISAETQVVTTESEYTIAVVVSGTADNPRVQFSADDPGLSQNDVLSLVTLGGTTTETQRQTGGVGTADVLALLPSEYVGNVQQRVHNLFGVDRIEVEPAYVPYSGTIEPRVTIGKDITDRIRALASSGFTVDARRMMQLEYRLTRRLSLLGSWEGSTQTEAGAFGGDLKFRYEFRRLPFSLWSDDKDSAAPANAH